MICPFVSTSVLLPPVFFLFYPSIICFSSPSPLFLHPLSLLFPFSFLSSLFSLFYLSFILFSFLSFFFSFFRSFLFLSSFLIFSLWNPLYLFVLHHCLILSRDIFLKYERWFINWTVRSPFSIHIIFSLVLHFIVDLTTLDIIFSKSWWWFIKIETL